MTSTSRSLGIVGYLKAEYSVAVFIYHVYLVVCSSKFLCQAGIVSSYASPASRSRAGIFTSGHDIIQYERKSRASILLSVCIYSTLKDSFSIRPSSFVIDSIPNRTFAAPLSLFKILLKLIPHYSSPLCAELGRTHILEIASEPDLFLSPCFDILQDIITSHDQVSLAQLNPASDFVQPISVPNIRVFFLHSAQPTSISSVQFSLSSPASESPFLPFFTARLYSSIPYPKHHQAPDHYRPPSPHCVLPHSKTPLQRQAHLLPSSSYHPLTYPTPTSMTDVWTCCICKNSNLIANCPECCPICGHFRTGCPRCTVGRPGLFDAKAAYQSQPQPHYQSQSQYAYPHPSSTTPRYGSTSAYYYGATPAGHYDAAASAAGTRYGYSRPAMTGWWVCCNSRCGQTNNPRLAPERCSTCGVQRCGQCYTYS